MALRALHPTGSRKAITVAAVVSRGQSSDGSKKRVSGPQPLPHGSVLFTLSLESASKRGARLCS